MSTGLSAQEKGKIDFQDGSHPGQLVFPIGILAIFDLVLSQLAFRFRRRNTKQTFKMEAMAAILDFQSEEF